jgi:photosystem II stability/assembly factor-like uncharacterized protein
MRSVRAVMCVLVAGCSNTLGATPAPGDGGFGARDGRAATDGASAQPDGQAPSSVTVRIEPRSSVVLVGRTLQLRATVTGSSDTGVDFAVTESQGCGSVDATGLYTAPASLPIGSCHVTATSDVSAEAFDTATLTITERSSTGAPGVWEDVTPDGVDLVNDFGVQDVVVDPARPSDLYAFVCKDGVYRSTDFGVTWTRVSTGRNTDVMRTGRPWGDAIDPNPRRDPSTAPTLWATNGYGSTQGVFRSTNFGVDWDHFDIGGGNEDLYDIDVDPYDSQHLIAGFHEAANVAESTDGGETWRVVPVEGHSSYPFFVDTGEAASTGRTWISISQEAGGLMRTTDSGTNWVTLDTDLVHAHGNAQILQLPGELYVSGFYGAEGHGIYRSTDLGAHFTLAFEGHSTTLFATATRMYSSNAGANGDGVDPQTLVAMRGDPGTWTPISAPPAMNNGAKRAAVTFDGEHYIIVSGNWNAGIWRYVEP